MDLVFGAIKSAIDAIYGAFQWLWNTLTGGSIWPEMMADLEKQTKVGMGEVGRLFEAGLEVGVIRPAAAIPAVGGQAASATTSHIEINFTIQGVTDPDEVARQVENRLVEVLSRRSEVTAA